MFLVYLAAMWLVDLGLVDLVQYLADVMVDGKTYVCTRQLGEGFGGSVDLVPTV